MRVSLDRKGKEQLVVRVGGNIDIQHLATADLLFVIDRVESTRSY